MAEARVVRLARTRGARAAAAMLALSVAVAICGCPRSCEMIRHRQALDARSMQDAAGCMPQATGLGFFGLAAPGATYNGLERRS